MEGSKVRELLQKFLDSHGSFQSIDSAVIDYACEVLATAIDEDGADQESLFHLDALLAGACGQAYEEIAEELRMQELLAVARVAYEAAIARPASAGRPEEVKTLLPVRNNGGAYHGIRDIPGSTRNQENVSPSGDATETSVSLTVIKELLILCANTVSEDFLRYALARRFYNDAEALAAWLVDSCQSELEAAQADWSAQLERELQQEAEARLLKERNKQQILQKFDLRPVPEPQDVKKAGKIKEPALEAWVGKQAVQATPKVRYLDGRVVSTKGEKFIVEKLGDEWDGGSRGKVYTKGKRGKGFV